MTIRIGITMPEGGPDIDHLDVVAVPPPGTAVQIGESLFRVDGLRLIVQPENFGQAENLGLHRTHYAATLIEVLR